MIMINPILFKTNENVIKVFLKPIMIIFNPILNFIKTNKNVITVLSKLKMIILMDAIF